VAFKKTEFISAKINAISIGNRLYLREYMSLKLPIVPTLIRDTAARALNNALSDVFFAIGFVVHAIIFMDSITLLYTFAGQRLYFYFLCPANF
jgi:hypothetical protein